MKHRILIYLLIVSACSASGKAYTPYETYNPLDPHNILIVYLSRTNNTKAVAEIIHEYLGGTLIELELQKPYPVNYQAIVQQVVYENETGYLPPLKTTINNMESYTAVFVGFPTWDMQLPPPMKSFLSQYDFDGKTIVPFNTNAGYGPGSSFATVKKLCPNSTVLEGYVTEGGVEKDGVYFVMKGEKEKQVHSEVRKWLQTIHFLK